MEPDFSLIFLFSHTFRKLIRIDLHRSIFWPFQWIHSVGVDHVHLKPSWCQKKRLGTKKSPTRNQLKRVKQIYSEQFTKSLKNKKNIREKSGSMKNENVLIEPEGHPEARERHWLHVSTVQGLTVEFRPESWSMHSLLEHLCYHEPRKNVDREI